MKGANIKLEKTVRLMNQKGLNGLIIYSKGVCNILSPSYLHYFSEFRPMGSRNAAVVAKSGEVVLLVEPAWDSFRAAAKSWIKDVQGGSDFVKDLTGIMRRLKISGPVGVAGSREMTQEVYSGIKKEADLQMADDIIEELAREKTVKEIEIIRKVARIADAGSDAFVNGARVGVREYDLVAALHGAAGLQAREHFVGHFGIVHGGHVEGNRVDAAVERDAAGVGGGETEQARLVLARRVANARFRIEHAHQALRDDAEQRGREQERLDTHVSQPRHRADRRVGVER